MKSLPFAGALVCASLFALAHAQVVPGASSTVAPTPSIDASSCCTLAAGTEIEIELAEPVDSHTRKRGDKFAIVVHTPVYVGQTLVIPVGTKGVGEIVHAQKSGGGGKPGELLLAARFLELDGRRISLRGMKLGVAGKDRTGTAMGASFAIGVFAQFIHGSEIQVPTGTLATAKVAEAFATTAPAIDTAQVTTESTNAVSKE